MRNLLFKILLFSLFCTVYPASIRAEMQCPVETNQDLGAFKNLSDPHQGEERKIGKWKKKVVEKYGRFFGQGNRDRRNGKIAAIVFLALGIIVFGVFGFTFLLAAVTGWYFWGTGFAIILVLVSLVLLALCVVCIRAMVRIIEKMRRLKHGEPPEELPRRPPSRNLKHQ